MVDKDNEFCQLSDFKTLPFPTLAGAEPMGVAKSKFYMDILPCQWSHDLLKDNMNLSVLVNTGNAYKHDSGSREFL